MRDINGNILKIGDTVVYVQGKNSDARLDTGVITKFYEGKYGIAECSVQSHSGKIKTHIRSFRILKL